MADIRPYSHISLTSDASRHKLRSHFIPSRVTSRLSTQRCNDAAAGKTHTFRILKTDPHSLSREWSVASYRLTSSEAPRNKGGGLMECRLMGERRRTSLEALDDGPGFSGAGRKPLISSHNRSGTTTNMSACCSYSNAIDSSSRSGDGGSSGSGSSSSSSASANAGKQALFAPTSQADTVVDRQTGSGSASFQHVSLSESCKEATKSITESTFEMLTRRRTRKSAKEHMSPSEAEWRLLLVDIGVQPRKISRILTQYTSMPADVAMERLMFFNSLGVDTGKALSSFPKLLFYPPSTAQAMANYLVSVGVKPGLVGKVLTTCPQLLGLSIENSICPAISHLVHAWGLDQSRDVPVVISRHPRCLTYSISENLQPTLAFWVGSGVSEPAKLIRANPSILGLSVTKRILPTIVAFDSQGIPPHHTISMVQKFPHLFNYSWHENLLPKLQYLEEVGRGTDEVVRHPQYFGYSLARRIRPRLGCVARERLHVSLSFLLRLKDEDFERLYGNVCRGGAVGGEVGDEEEQECC